jgi:hypothetical protein
MIYEVFHGFRHPLSETTWAETPTFTTISDRLLMLAARTENPDKATLQNSARQVVAKLFGDADRHGAAFDFAVSDKRLNIRC